MKKTKLVYLTFFLLFFLIIACKERKENPVVGRTYAGVLFSAPYNIEVVGDSTDYQPQIDSIFYIFHQLFDTNSPQSIVSQFNAFTNVDSTFIFRDSSLVFGIVYDLMRDMHQKTNQLYDPTLNPLKREWMKIRMIGVASLEPNLDSLYEFVGYDGAKVDLLEVFDDKGVYERSILRKKKPQTEIDLTSLARAYALDMIGDFFNEKNIPQYRIECGNSTICKGLLVEDLNHVRLGVGTETSDQELNLINRSFSFKTSEDKQFLIDISYGYPVANEMAYVGVSGKTLVESEVFSEVFMIMGIEASAAWYEGHADSDIQSFMLFKQDSVLSYASTEAFQQLLITPDTLIEQQ